jgi:hypothetical protein
MMMMMMNNIHQNYLTSNLYFKFVFFNL